MTHDPTTKDFYATLGVDTDADAATIKKAYRKLARQLHPDKTAGNPALAERFKAVAEAYDILSDPAKRADYDTARTRQPQFTWPGAGFTTTHTDTLTDDDLASFFRLFTDAAPNTTRPRRGADTEAHLTVSFADVLDGATLPIRVNDTTTTVRIPPGVHDGQHLRLPGLGRPGSNGGPPGDIYARITVTPDPRFRLDGTTITVTVPISIAEAALGATITVPMPRNRTVTLKIPAGTQHAQTFRVRRHGIKTPHGLGDVHVTVHVHIPTTLTTAQRHALEQYAAASTADPRQPLFDEAV